MLKRFLSARWPRHCTCIQRTFDLGSYPRGKETVTGIPCQINDTPSLRKRLQINGRYPVHLENWSLFSVPLSSWPELESLDQNLSSPYRYFREIPSERNAETAALIQDGGFGFKIWGSWVLKVQQTEARSTGLRVTYPVNAFLKSTNLMPAILIENIIRSPKQWTGEDMARWHFYSGSCTTGASIPFGEWSRNLHHSHFRGQNNILSFSGGKNFCHFRGKRKIGYMEEWGMYMWVGRSRGEMVHFTWNWEI